MLDYELEYVDLLTLCPQWHDIWVRETLRSSLTATEARILDCGANVGLASLYFRARHPGCRITAFEADPAIADVMRGNLARNGCSDVEVVPAAVWTTTGTVPFRCEGADSGAVESVAGELPGETQVVPSVRLRSYLIRETVDLLKLDIEGAEKAVLEDCADALANVRAVVMELHEVDIERRCTTEVLQVLSNAGFQWSLDDLVPFAWRPPFAPDGSPFPGAHGAFSMLVRAWRPTLGERSS